MNEAALLAARYDKTKIGMDDFNESVDRVVAGPQRKSRIMNERTREKIAYHEVGHALVGELLPNADPVHKISILPRGRALGYTLNYPTEDKYMVTRDEFLDRISTSLAGRVAEETVFNEITTGASSDFEHATTTARAMVCEYGMSERLGPVVLGTRHGNPFLGRDWNEERNYSETIAVEIDKEVRSIIDECYERSRQILTENRVKMDEIVRVLLEKEMLEREDFLASDGRRESAPNRRPARLAAGAAERREHAAPRRLRSRAGCRTCALNRPNIRNAAFCRGGACPRHDTLFFRPDITTYGYHLPLPSFPPRPHPKLRDLLDLGGGPAHRPARSALCNREPHSPRHACSGSRPACFHRGRASGPD